MTPGPEPHIIRLDLRSVTCEFQNLQHGGTELFTPLSNLASMPVLGAPRCVLGSAGRCNSGQGVGWPCFATFSWPSAARLLPPGLNQPGRYKQSRTANVAVRQVHTGQVLWCEMSEGCMAGEGGAHKCVWQLGQLW